MSMMAATTAPTTVMMAATPIIVMVMMVLIIPKFSSLVKPHGSAEEPASAIPEACAASAPTKRSRDC
jgi:hypothetical protein